ncbi:MAG: cation:dicarboxylase symporter family transporter [Eubacterium sp.]|nr:cation:dicarboxylase symporter family transporter [Eubacterium sp.]
MKQYKRFSADTAGIGQAMEFTRGCLTEVKIKGKELARATLTAEEAVGALVAHADEGSTVDVTFRSRFGDVTIEAVSHGQSFDLSKNMDRVSTVGNEAESESTQEVLRGILLKSFTDGIKYNHKNGVNRIRMTAVRSRHTFLYRTLGAMLAAIVFGVLMANLTPESWCDNLSEYALDPIRTMYISALKMCVAPVVFFSIVTCVMQFSDLKEMGRIGAKVFGMYLFTTVIATGVGLGMYYLFQPGSADMIPKVAQDVSSITSQTVDTSIMHILVDVVPSNFIKPFLESDMLQLIFLAVLCGVAVGKIGKYSQTLCDLLKAGNELFMKITTMIIRFMPIVVFCAISSMIMGTGFDTILSLLGVLGTFILGILCMMVVYCLLMLVIGRMNPLPFLRKYPQTMLQVFSMASSNASIPINMEACEKKLGIARRVYSLSIPLGATVNMDGDCLYLSIAALALAKAYGITITGATLATMIISIIILSVGAPGIPGSGLICLSVLLGQIGVPLEGIAIVMGIDALMGMFRAMSNCLGDVVVTTIVAKSEGLMDKQIYKS